MRLFILRHGTTYWNTLRKIQGATNTPLDAKGEEIARISGQALHEQGIHFHAVYSSPLNRAVRTAQLVSPGSTIHTDQRLQELHFGLFEGRRLQDLIQDETSPFRYFYSQPEKYNEALLLLEKQAPEKGYESFTSLIQRASDFMRSVIEPLASDTPADACILISGHGALDRALMMYIRRSTDLTDFWGKGPLPNCGFCIVDVSVTEDTEGSRVRYSIEDENKIYYDPELIHIPRLPSEQENSSGN